MRSTDSSAATWTAPLNRRITMRLGQVTLRTGLERLAAEAHIRLSYAAEFLPLDQTVCATYRGVSAGTALAELLRGTVLEPIIVGADQVVLAPVRGQAADERPVTPAPAARAPSLLESVVVNGRVSADDAGTQALPITVVSRKQLLARGGTSLAEALEGAVPGFWMWSQSPATPLARYAGVRGASSFGASYPKVYVDGVEVANPQLVSRLNVETIDRIEVLRGPQGAALYGADAISGVINIFTLHEGSSTGTPRVNLRTETGVSSSDFTSNVVMARDLWLAARTGSNLRSAGLNVSVSTLGDFIPGGASRQVLASGDVRTIGRSTTFSATARVFDWQAGVATNPLYSPVLFRQPSAESRRTGSMGLERFGAAPTYASHGEPGESPSSPEAPETSLNSAPPGGDQSAREYTLGAAVSAMPNDTWTWGFVLGLDGYRSAGVTSALPTDVPVASAAGAQRGTLRATSETRFGGNAWNGRLSLALDHSMLRESVGSDFSSGPLLPDANAFQVAWRSTTGAIAQTSVALASGLALNGGLRVEWNDGYATFQRMAVLPMLSAAYVIANEATSLTLRSSYGKAIRPPRSTALEALSPLGVRVSGAAVNLAPEEQTGVDWGADLSIGKALSLRATRFDQQASGLIDAVAVTYGGHGPGPGPHGIRYMWQNVGDVSNRGWEFEGTTHLSALSVTGALSLVESRVERLASGYAGELRSGDRMLEVPRRIASLTASWLSAGWSTSWTVSRASDWMGYDQLGIASALTQAEASETRLADDFLRQFWVRYPGVTHLRATASRDLFRGFSLSLTGENLLNYQRGERDNVTIVPGRTLLLGLRARF